MAKQLSKTADRAAIPAANSEPEFFSRQITAARRFYLQLNPPWKTPIVVVTGGYELTASDYQITRTDFPYFVVEFVASGEGTITMGGTTHSLRPGVVFAYGSGVPHHYLNNAKRPMEKYFVMLAGDEVLRRLAAPAPRPGEIIQSSSPAHILQLFEDLIDAGRRESPYREQICQMIMEHMLLRIAETAVSVGTIETAAFESFQRCRTWIEKHYRRVNSLPEIADQCRVDPAYICRLFKRFSHYTPWQYVLRLKMRDAAERLLSHQMRVSQVAYESGFDDPFQFSRTFKRVLGISPQQFVRLQQRRF